MLSDFFSALPQKCEFGSKKNREKILVSSYGKKSWQEWSFKVTPTVGTNIMGHFYKGHSPGSYRNANSIVRPVLNSMSQEKPRSVEFWFNMFLILWIRKVISRSWLFSIKSVIYSVTGLSFFQSTLETSMVNR